MKKYKVIWFDDEFDKLELIWERASLNNIELIGFKNAQEGIFELEKEIEIYDAAIVDGKFFRTSAEVGGDALGDLALFDVAKALNRLEVRKKLPWYILSGQVSFTRQKNPLAESWKNNEVFDKTNSVELELLWDKLKTEANLQEDTKVRHLHSRIFDICVDRYIGEGASKDLLNILKREYLTMSISSPENYFNQLRKILEDLFRACNRVGLLPDVFIKPSISLNESGNYLAGNVEKGMLLNPSIVPEVIKKNLRFTLERCQNGSHRLDVDSFITQFNSPYLLYSITYQLLDILLWFKSFVDQNPSKENNILLSTCHSVNEMNIIEGVVSCDSDNNYYCGEYLLPFKLTQQKFKVGDRIRIVEIQSNNNPHTLLKFPLRASRFEKI